MSQFNDLFGNEFEIIKEQKTSDYRMSNEHLEVIEAFMKYLDVKGIDVNMNLESQFVFFVNEPKGDLLEAWDNGLVKFITIILEKIISKEPFIYILNYEYTIKNLDIHYFANNYSVYFDIYKR